jgi:uncharacterized membrane protein YhaH (DUF805 family)
VKPLLQFFFPSRLARVSYLIRATIYDGLAYYLYPSVVIGKFPEILAFVLIAIYVIWFVMLPRIRDTGMSAYWIILAFVPFANVFLSCALIFRRSDPRQNPLWQHLNEPVSNPAPGKGV